MPRDRHVTGCRHRVGQRPRGSVLSLPSLDTPPGASGRSLEGTCSTDSTATCGVTITSSRATRDGGTCSSSGSTSRAANGN